MPGPPFLEGEHVSLCTITPEGVGFLERVVNDQRVRRDLARHEPVHRHQEDGWVESVGEDGSVDALIVGDGEPVDVLRFGLLAEE